MTWPGWAEAALWALVASSSGLCGCLGGLFVPLGRRVLAAVMAFGAGALLGAVAFDVLPAARDRGGPGPAVAGFLAGALIFTVIDFLLDRRGAVGRKHSGDPDEPAGRGPEPGSGAAAPRRPASRGPRPGAAWAILAGAVLDGVPEAFALGVDLFAGHGLSWALVVGIFLSTLPEGLSGSVGLKRAGYRRAFIVLLWAAVAGVAAPAAAAGFLLAERLAGVTEAVILALAGGAVVAMAADTLTPEAYREGGNLVGLITALGMILTFILAVEV
ncbi:ZIP family metal transporter [Thermaerobacter subterraneus]|uniref:Divalent heavy-metal cations transporter n=1 Tax=Thermaerobacter subterraneus DSM 13965 TaxID=867903 RepID=K6NYZ4_9FIRM|nr:ZIP family metal transporter [Thermaerobacter subterraneus]EKP94075.1 putative divalent heavy-metal cations transporter [Thermaerobacter subterraneus DSM 13965]